MPKGRTVRVCAVANGQLSLLFKVEEKNDGSLLLISKSAEFFEAESGQVQFSGEHTSIHNSERSVRHGTTITRKVTLSDGTQLDNVAFVPETQTSLLWMVQARRPPDIRGERYVARVKARDELLEVATYDPRSSSLHYTIFCTRPDFPAEELLAKNWDFVVVKFRLYVLVVVVAFTLTPSIGEGDYVFSVTSAEVVNKVRDEHHWQYEAESIPYADAEMRLQLAWTQLGNLHLQRLTKMFRAAPEIKEDQLVAIFKAALSFYRKPAASREELERRYKATL